MNLGAVIRGEGPSPYEVVLLIPGLPEDGWVSAIQQARAHGYADDQAHRFLGWTTDRWIATNTYDAINQNTLATGNWKKGSTPKFEPFPTPLSEKPKRVEETKGSAINRIFSMLTGR